MTVIPVASRPQHRAASTAYEEPVDWRGLAACRETDPELFFPEGSRGGAPLARAEERAKAICRRCPVIGACREWALGVVDLHGVAGGMTQDERDAARGFAPLRAPRRPGELSRPEKIAASPGEFLRLDAGHLSDYEIARALHTNVHTVREVRALLAERATERAGGGVVARAPLGGTVVEAVAS